MRWQDVCYEYLIKKQNFHFFMSKINLKKHIYVNKAN